MVDSTTFVPQRKLITDPGYIPASPFIATDASRNYNRWNAYWLQPRGTLGPFQVGLHGMDNPGVGSLAACCDSCAKGGPCTGCLNGIATGRYLTMGMFTPGMGGIVESMQEKTDGYAIPVILGTALGYLAERKSGAVLGAVAGAGLKWVYSTYLSPFVAPLLPAAPATGVDGFRDDFALNPGVSPLDSPLDRSAFRFLQLILIVGATTLAVKVGKGLMKPKKANRRRNGGPRRRNPVGVRYRIKGYAYELQGKNWRRAKDDSWDTEVVGVEGPMVGRRRIDGSDVVVIRAEQADIPSDVGKFYAITIAAANASRV